MMGLRVWDGMRAVDYLATRPEADSARLGAMGISGGGAHTYFSTACDDRIRACVISGYFCDWRQSILTVNHCTCNFVPGLLRHGELSDFAGLIAPRPCLIEAGRRDTIFPIAGVRATVERAKAAWRAFGAEDALATDEFDGRHQDQRPARLRLPRTPSLTAHGLARSGGEQESTAPDACWPALGVQTATRASISVYRCDCTGGSVHEGQSVRSVVGHTGNPQRLSGAPVPQAPAVP